MWPLILIIFLGWYPGQARAVQEWIHPRFADRQSSYQIPWRMINMSKTTYHDAVLRMHEINHIRFMYERTPFYEQGYVFAEIIERYKKMVEQYHRLTQFSSSQVFDGLDRVEHIQKLYFEVYHLVMMMHEIPRKYKHVKEFKTLMYSQEELESSKNNREAFLAAERQREAEARMLAKAKKQIAENRMGGASGALLGMKTKLKYVGKPPSELGHDFYDRWDYIYGWEPPEF